MEVHNLGWERRYPQHDKVGSVTMNGNKKSGSAVEKRRSGTGPTQPFSAQAAGDLGKTLASGKGTGGLGMQR